MSTWGDHRATLAGKLAAAGLTATLDPAALPPCVLIDAFRGGGRPSQGIGAWPGVVLVRVIATPPGDARALEWLEDTAETVARTLGWVAPDFANVSHGGRDCPAYTFTYPADMPNPDC